MNQSDVPDTDSTQSQGTPGGDLPMPALPGDPAVDGTPESSTPTPPPSAIKQAAQLIIIPATIVIVCVGLATLFGKLAGAEDSIDSHLMKLSQSSGSGRLAMGLQDPRYKDRWLAAYDVAVMIPTIHEPVEKLRVSRKLTDILNEHIGDNEPVLEAYLLMALGQLGQTGGFGPILQRIDAPRARTRQGAISATLMWPDRDVAAGAIEKLCGRLEDPETTVGASAAAALGELGSPDDGRLIDALQEALDRPGTQFQEVRWNAAVALAKLSDPMGSRFVASVLLDRQALGEQLVVDPSEQQNPHAARTMQDRIILTTLASAKSMGDREIWNRIERIAEEDPNRSIRNAARQLVLGRRDAAGLGSGEPRTGHPSAEHGSGE